jgi:hypothetical protein
MGVFDIFTRNKKKEPDADVSQEKYSTPTLETMFMLNTMATDIMNSGEFAKYGFESQLELVAAFTIVETLGAAGDSMSDAEIIELIARQFQLDAGRCAFLVRQAHRSQGNASYASIPTDTL